MVGLLKSVDRFDPGRGRKRAGQEQDGQPSVAGHPPSDPDTAGAGQDPHRAAIDEGSDMVPLDLAGRRPREGIEPEP